MKKFFSAKIITESGDDLLGSLLDLIDPKYIRDRNQILKDISLHESLKEGKCARFGHTFVHTARTFGIEDFCLSCAQTDDGILETLILWSDISVHHLSRLAEIAGLFEKMSSQNSSNDEIIAALKKM